MNPVKLIVYSMLLILFAVTPSAFPADKSTCAVMNLKALEGRKYTILGNTQATDTRVCLFGILPISGANSVRTALNKAAEKAGGDALIDITVESYTHYWILFSSDITKVEGIAIRFNK